MKKIISIILACAVLFSMIAVQADEVTSGVCGDNITWRFEDKTIYFEGTGPMYEFEDGKQPWIHLKDVMDKVYISDGITSVGGRAFARIGGIKELYLPDSIETIGIQAFFRSLSMEELKMPANLKSVGDYGFRYSNVYRFILNPNASYPGWCFDGCGVGEVIIPAGMKVLPSYLFVGCTGLKKINFPEGMTTIGNFVFDACSGLESVALPKSMTSVGNGAFRACTKLDEVIVLNPKMRFGSDTFLNVEALTILAESGSAAETYALANNINFKPINVIGKDIQWLSNKGVLRISGKGAIPDFEEGMAPWDSEAAEIKSVVVGEGITSIGSYAFAGLGDIESISLPTTLNKVDDTSFGNMEFLKILSENNGKVPLGTIYSAKILKTDSNAYSLMMGLAVTEQEEGEDGAYIKTKGATFVPVVLDADTKGVVNFNVETVKADDDDSVKAFIWKYPEMVDFKANAEQGMNELSAENYAYINDGKIKISGSLGTDATGEATLLIVPAEYDMLNGEDWKEAKVVHVDNQTVGSKGEYEFKVAFTEEGEYTAYIGNSSLRTPRVVSIIYTNKANSEQAISDINDATTVDEMVEIVNRKMSLQLFSELYDTVIADEDMVKEASELLIDYLSDETVSTGEEAQAAIYKAFAITLINNDKLEDVTKYAKEIFTDDTEAIDYIKFTKSEKITEIVESRKNDSIKNFDENYAEGILRVLIQYNNGTDEIKKALTKYSDLLEIKESKITKAVCMSMAGKKFSSLDEIADYVTDYKAPSSGGGNGGGGGGGRGSSSGGLTGGSSIKKNDAAENYNNNRFENTKTEAESTGEIKIKPFDDLEGYEWAEDSIVGLFKKGIVSGKSEKSFCPQDYITREEFAKLVAMAVNINVKSGTLPFEDVSTEDWFYSYVKKLYSAGVITGISETVFGTGTNITRQDAVVMIDRAMDKCGLIAEEYEKSGDFGDSDKISDYAVTSVEKLKSNGMITGDDNNNFNPEASITRAESAVLLYRVYEKAAAAQ